MHITSSQLVPTGQNGVVGEVKDNWTDFLGENLASCPFQPGADKLVAWDSAVVFVKEASGRVSSLLESVTST